MLHKRSEYVENYQEREGIVLDPTLIAKNPGRKMTAKLILNSLWGKFEERTNKFKVTQLTQAHELFALLNSPLVDISALRILNTDLLEVSYKRISEDADRDTKTNTFIAASTTCQARLKLYQFLEQLGDLAFYYDTDSEIRIVVGSLFNLEVFSNQNPFGSEYVDKYQEREGIVLDPTLIAKNPGRLGVVRLGVKEVVTPEGPACTIVGGGDETGMGEEPTPTPTPNGEVGVVVVVPNMFCNVLSGEKLTSSFTS
ncbi:hypothetical protein AWC38_SpisGene21763 [Stylophora pistillata]|uniref:DNA-directed DNA polymerase n=1 Tax=Stylophora pistillata TaxID=50429 RepID=A0A2B4RBC9_STYPI|nr:hypothetical protein AWC38_SpisGene21763 [Stylophora pistillata]